MGFIDLFSYHSHSKIHLVVRPLLVDVKQTSEHESLPDIAWHWIVRIRLKLT
jgi:hypothetical protein